MKQLNFPEKLLKLAIVSSHPVQYNAPWFRLLSEMKRHDIKVFYTWSQTEQGVKFDPGFEREVEWDVPLLEGYNYEFVENIAKDPGTHHFQGIDNPGLTKTINSWKPDAILVFGWSFKSHLKCLRYYHGKIPVIFRGDSTLLDEKNGLKTSARRIFLHWVYSFVDYALVAGTNNKNYFLTHGMTESSLVLARHAIDNERFGGPDTEYANKARLWRNRLDFQPDDFVILFAGKFEKKKNPLFLLTIAEAIKSPQFKFLFVGNGEMESIIKAKASTDSRIRVLDFQNQTDMPVVYRMANLFVLPSVGPGETWGLALNEAMACGIPVMASQKTGGAIDLISEGINGIIIDLNNPERSFSYIEQLHADSQLYKSTAAANRQKVRQFSFQAIVDNINSLLDHIKNNHAGN